MNFVIRTACISNQEYNRLSISPVGYVPSQPERVESVIILQDEPHLKSY